MNVRVSYSIREAARHSGLSLWMVDYLCRTQLLVPTETQRRGRGRARLYSFGDIVMLRALKKLLANGIEVAKLKAGLKLLRKLHPEITPTHLPAGLLWSDGRTVFMREGQEIVQDLVRGQYAFAFVLELGQLRSEVMATIPARKLKTARSTGT